MISFNVFSWVVILTFVSISIFSLKLVFFCLSLLIICLLLLYIALYHHAHNQSKPENWTNSDDNLRLKLLTLPKLLKFFSRKEYLAKPVLQRGDSLCGDPFIDEQLRDIIELLYRDVIIPWYSTISDNTETIDDLKCIIYSLIRSMSARIYQIDKLQYLTTQLVDDFASHLRLYRSAEQQLRVMKIQDANANLLSIFFDLELQMEKNKICRDVVSEHHDSFINYLTHICDIMMYLLLSPEVFENRLTRYSLRHIVVHSLLIPVFQLLSDPDFINRSLIWLFKSKANFHSTPETFLLLLRCCEDSDELNSVLEMVHKEIAIQRSKDTGEDDYIEIKQQLSSLLYVESVIKNRLKCLNEGSYDDNDTNGEALQKYTYQTANLFQLPFDVIFQNNIALSYFIEYMSSINLQGYVYFYLNIEGFRVSAEQQLAKNASSGQTKSAECQSLREAAFNIYETYLSAEKRNTHKVKISETVARQIHSRIKSSPLSANWFDEAQEQVVKTIKEDVTMFPNFKKSIHYVKLLKELDLLSVNINNNTYGDSQQDDESSQPFLVKSRSDPDVFRSNRATENPNHEDAPDPDGHSPEYHLKVEISNTGIVREFGNSYGVYCISIAKKEPFGPEEKWCILRRYSDFDFLHQCLCEKFDLQIKSRLSLPGKRPFNNVNSDFLEQRRHLLNSYLQQLARLCEKDVIYGLRNQVKRFLEPGNYEKEKSNPLFTKTVNSLVLNPFKSSVKTVGNVVRVGSENLKDGLQKLARLGQAPPHTGSSRRFNAFNSRESLRNRNGNNNNNSSPTSENGAYPQINSDKVGAALDAENDIDNIPLRIMLLLMDEVFELKSKNLWLRRRIVGVVRNIIKSTFGDTINRKILEYVEDVTSPSAMSDYLRYFKNTLWPNNGKMVTDSPERDLGIKMRTKTSAKLLLLATFSEEIKHIIGTDTTRKGLFCVYQMFQNQTFNHRLLIVIFEGLLHQLFPKNNIPLILMKLHSTSPRMKDRRNKESPIKWPPSLNRHPIKISSSSHSLNRSSPQHLRRR